LFTENDEVRSKFLRDIDMLLERMDSHLYLHEKKMITKWIEKIENSQRNEKLIYSEALNTLTKSINERMMEIREIKKGQKDTNKITNSNVYDLEQKRRTKQIRRD
jgi:hypothetical protein